MTMNIMSVGVPSGSELGGLAVGKASTAGQASGAGKNAEAAKGGLFADVLSKESEHQSSTSSNQGSVALTAKDAVAKDQSVKEPAAAESRDQTQLGEPSETEAQLDANGQAEGAKTSTEKAGLTAESEITVEGNEQPSPTTAALAQTPLATLNLVPELESAELKHASQTQADKNLADSKTANSKAAEKAAASGQANTYANGQVDTETDSEANAAAESEAAKRQGGRALPPEIATSIGQAANNAGSVSEKSALTEGVANAKSLAKTASQHADNLTLSESPAKSETATKAAATATQTHALNSATTSVSGAASSVALSAGTGDAASTAPLSEGAAKEAGRQPSAHSSINSSVASGVTPTPTTQAVSSPLVASAVPQANDKAAQILAEHAEVNVQAKVTEQNANAEQNTRALSLAPDTAARAAAPEWLAQIEHGKRWSQGPNTVSSKAGVNVDADTALALGEKSSAAQAINAALAKSERNQDAEPLTALANNTAHFATMGTADANTQSFTSGQEASGLLINREHTLLAATPERTAMLDKALTLHGSAEQNAKQLAQQAQVVVSQNLQEADIKLNPSEFGAMRIQIRMEQGEVQVQFVASHPQARELLEQAMPRLREMLQQQGMNLQQGQQQSSQQQAGQQTHQQQSGQNQSNGSFLSQGFAQGESGQPGQQQAGQQASQTGQESQWRSYSASGDAIQEQTLDSQPHTQDGADGAKIDFFA